MREAFIVFFVLGLGREPEVELPELLGHLRPRLLVLTI